MFELSKIVNGDCIKQSPIRRIMEMADPTNIKNKFNLDPSKVISFAGGWVNHKAPEELREEYQKLVNDEYLFHSMGAYSSTEGDPKLRALLAEMDGEIYCISGLTSENVLIGQSSTQLLSGLFVTILNPEDKILVFDPTYANYLEQVYVRQGQKLSTITLKVFDNKTWTYMNDEENILSSVEEVCKRERPKAILFSSPDNPTGQIPSDQFVESILHIAQEYGAFILIDNAYRAQYFTQRPPRQFSFSPIHFQNLILIHSNSKWCRGLGRRLGWIEADRKIIAALKSVQQTMILCPDTMHQVALANYIDRGLKNGSLRRYLEENRRRYENAAEFTSQCIEKYLGMRYLKPQGGLYTVVDVCMDGEIFVEEVLRNTGVIFVPGKGFGESLGNGIRVSFGPLVNDFGKIEEGFSRVQNFLNKRKHKEVILTAAFDDSVAY